MPAAPTAPPQPALLDVELTIGSFPIKHMLPAEQVVNTPVPIYFEPPDGIQIMQAKLVYKPFGAANWKAQEMVRLGTGFGIELPCVDTSTTGDIKYYITLVGGDGQPLESLGSKERPLRVSIKNEIEGDEPRLPGKKPPRHCSSCSELPPGNPLVPPYCEMRGPDQRRWRARRRTAASPMAAAAAPP
jgi:hypothetical protein